jgi:chemotaxis response regulator CheB
MVVDDNAEVRKSLRPLVDSHRKFFVCGEAEHGRDAGRESAATSS